MVFFLVVTGWPGLSWSVIWKDDYAVMLLKDEKSVLDRKGVKKIHKAQMVHTYQEAGNLIDEVRKLIDDVVETCHVCKKNERSKSKPLVAVSQSLHFNAQLQEHEEYKVLEVLLVRRMLIF